MPLRDHFHPPLSGRRHWQAFHAGWATYLSAYLNRLLPAGYFAEPYCTFTIEIDVAVLDEDEKKGAGLPPWTLPPPALTVPIAAATETVEVRLFAQQGGPELAGCIELVSPANKDRPAEREAFVSKCAAYLHEGAGLVVVDIVTERHANLHGALLARVSPPGTASLQSLLYAASYRPVRLEDRTELNVWQESLTLGQPLPSLPFCLKGGLCLPLDLEATYEQTCRELRILSNGAPT